MKNSFDLPPGWCMLGVGSGDTGLFVYGPYEAIKVCQEKLLSRPSPAPQEQPADKASLWKHNYYELRHTVQDWHAQAVGAGFDGVSVVLLVAAESVKLFDALNAMLTHFGMDEDEWNRPTFKQAKEAIAQYKAARASPAPQVDQTGAQE